MIILLYFEICIFKLRTELLNNVAHLLYLLENTLVLYFQSCYDRKLVVKQVACFQILFVAVLVTLVLFNLELVYMANIVL